MFLRLCIQLCTHFLQGVCNVDIVLFFIHDDFVEVADLLHCAVVEVLVDFAG